tara:strand:- start:173 stop:511 length:339 start_codon:yes stop_codon:yes gene_type:complete
MKTKIVVAMYISIPVLGLISSLFFGRYEPRLLDGPYPFILQPDFFDYFVGISLWCIGYVVTSFIFAIHKSIDKESYEEVFGDTDAMMLKLLWFPMIFAITFYSLVKNIITNF